MSKIGSLVPINNTKPEVTNKSESFFCGKKVLYTQGISFLNNLEGITTRLSTDLLKRKITIYGLSKSSYSPHQSKRKEKHQVELKSYKKIADIPKIDLSIQKAYTQALQADNSVEHQTSIIHYLTAIKDYYNQEDRINGISELEKNTLYNQFTTLCARNILFLNSMPMGKNRAKKAKDKAKIYREMNAELCKTKKNIRSNDPLVNSYICASIPLANLTKEDREIVFNDCMQVFVKAFDTDAYANHLKIRENRIKELKNEQAEIPQNNALVSQLLNTINELDVLIDAHEKMMANISDKNLKMPVDFVEDIVNKQDDIVSKLISTHTKANASKSL